MAWFWNLLVLQRHCVFLPGGDFFAAVLTASSRRQQNLLKNAVSSLAGVFFAESFHAVAGCLHGTIPPPLGATLVFVPDESAYFAL